MKVVIDISDERWVSALDGTWCGSAEIPKGIPLENVLQDIKAEIEETKAEIIKVIRTQNRKNLLEYVNGLNACLCIIDSKMHMSAE